MPGATDACYRLLAADSAVAGVRALSQHKAPRHARLPRRWLSRSLVSALCRKQQQQRAHLPRPSAGIKRLLSAGLLEMTEAGSSTCSMGEC